MPKSTAALPLENRLKQGAALFIASLTMFFLGSIVLYLLYAYWRRDVVQPSSLLPGIFVLSTLLLVLISALSHQASRTVRRDHRKRTAAMLALALLLAFGFLVAQGYAIWQMMESPEMRNSFSQGVGGMVVILAILHALHVVGGIISLGIVSVRSFEGRYDHERHGAVDFAASYWHFLDLVWLLMLFAFWMTTAGFAF